MVCAVSYLLCAGKCVVVGIERVERECCAISYLLCAGKCVVVGIERVERECLATSRWLDDLCM
jgi:hypothetical protein